jgi:hypothetical protein
MTNTNDNENAAHCKIGPSTLPARVVCPCHESAPGGADAQSGTRSHKVVEANIANGQSCTPTDPNLFGVTESPEMMGVKPADNYLPGTTEDEIGRGVWGAKTIMRLRDENAPGAYIYTETRAKFADTLSEFSEKERETLRGKFGTVDAFWKSEDGATLFIADYKTYANADSEKCYKPQGMMYAALLKSEKARNATAVVFFVVAGGDRTVARYDFDMEAAIGHTVETIRRVDAIQSGAVFATGDEARTKCGKPSAWCKTCAHAAACPAISRAVAIVSNGGIFEKPLAVRMAIIPVIESFVKRVKAEVKAVLDAGGRVADDASGIEYGYAERRGKSRLADLRGLAQAAIGYGVKPEDFAGAVSISKTAVDALLKAVEEAEGRKVPKADREAVYAPFFTEPGIERYIKRIS